LLFDESSNIRFFTGETSIGLPGCFLRLPVSGVQFMPENAFHTFHREGCELSRLSAPWKEGEASFYSHAFSAAFLSPIASANS